MTSRSRGPLCPRFAQTFSPKRGSRECRVRAAPAVSCAIVREIAHTSIQVKRRHPASPAQWLYGLWRALLGDEFVFVTVAAGLMAERSGWIAFATGSLT